MKRTLILFGLVVVIVTTTFFATASPKQADKVIQPQQMKATAATNQIRMYWFYPGVYPNHIWTGWYQTLDEVKFNTGLDECGTCNPHTLQYIAYLPWNTYEDQYGDRHPLFSSPDGALYSHP